MSILYMFSLALLAVSVILVKKNDKKWDLIKTATVTMVLLICYQTCISYICTMLKIPITIPILMLINIVISAVLIGKMIHDKNRQMYFIEKKDLFVISIFVIVILILVVLDFGIPFQIKYLTTDAAIHYMSAREFFEHKSLLSNVENIDSSHAMMPGAYSNIGILFKVFEPIIGEMNLYQIMIGFDVFILLLSVILFYETIKKYAKTRIGMVVACLISLIYMLGYPLNNLLFGYFYLGIGVLVTNAILAIMQDFQEDMNLIQKIGALFLLCFELFFSYYLFVPGVFGAVFIFYTIYFIKKNKKWISKDWILYTVITLVIPTILGFCYHVLPGLLSKDQIQVGNVIQLEGYIYRNFYSNLLLFIPFVLYYLRKEAQEKQIHFDVILLLIWLSYMCVLWIGIFKLNISTYYFFKTYFILWQLVIYLCYRGIAYALNERKKYAPYVVVGYMLMYGLIFVYSICFQRVSIDKNILPKENPTDVMNIFGINKTVLCDVEIDYTKEELAILQKVNELDVPQKSDNILILGNQRQEYWFYAIFGYRQKSNLDYATKKEDIEQWNQGKDQYLIYFKRSADYQRFKEILQTSPEQVIYENEAGAILSYK